LSNATGAEGRFVNVMAAQTTNAGLGFDRLIRIYTFAARELSLDPAQQDFSRRCRDFFSRSAFNRMHVDRKIFDGARAAGFVV
jgi:hypothetical protein